ncbi:hypothetical protein FIU78_00385 [Lactobacillus buchneri]|nr:hypothetical protein [Lentilactobacillus buchneri]
MDQVWDKIEEDLNRTVSRKFRSAEDINVFIFRYWQLLSGNFSPRKVSFGKYYDLSDDNSVAFEDLSSGRHKVIVLNDQENIDNFDIQKKKLHHIFELCKRHP